MLLFYVLSLRTLSDFCLCRNLLIIKHLTSVSFYWVYTVIKCWVMYKSRCTSGCTSGYRPAKWTCSDPKLLKIWPVAMLIELAYSPRQHYIAYINTSLQNFTTSYFLMIKNACRVPLIFYNPWKCFMFWLGFYCGTKSPIQFTPVTSSYVLYSSKLKWWFNMYRNAT